MSATDPFDEIESPLSWHLATTHNEVVARLIDQASRVAATRPGAPIGPGPRYRVRFRLEGNDGGPRSGLPFHKLVNDMTGRNQAIRVLLS